MGALTALWNRVYAVLGRMSMYRLVYFSLAALAAVALLLSFFGLVGPGPLQLIATLAVLSAVCVGVDAAAQRLLRLPWRIESSLITAHILLFVLHPTFELVAVEVPPRVARAAHLQPRRSGRDRSHAAEPGVA